MWVVLLLTPLLWTTGCTTYSAKFANLRPELVSGQYDAALQTVAKESGSKDRLLYFLERGLILHFAGRYAESNIEFTSAERLADDLYTKSISEGALSLLSNDNAISYRARPFEMAMVPYYKALNYIYLGAPSEAQVEARRASQQMSQYVTATLEGVREQDGDLLRKVRSNAFLLYYSGMLYDSDGEINDAFTAYRNAALAFQQNHRIVAVDVPPSLGQDLQRVAARLGFQSELQQLRKDCPEVFAGAGSQDNWQGGQGEVVLLLESGFVAQKQEVRFDFPVFEGEAYDDPDYWSWEYYGGMGNLQALTRGRKVEYWVSVAAPELKDPPSRIAGARVSAGAVGVHAVTTKVANLSREARIEFEAEKPTIIVKTIARGLTKYLASRKLKGKSKAAGMLANLFGAVTESADTRSWLTLPDGIHLARLNLKPGTYDLKVEVLGAQGRVLATETIAGVVVRAGEWTFLSRRVF